MPVEGGEEAGKTSNNMGYGSCDLYQLWALGRTRWFTCSTTLLGNPFSAVHFWAVWAMAQGAGEEFGTQRQ